MPSSLSKRLSNTFRRASVSSRKGWRVSVSAFNGMCTYTSDAEALADVEFPDGQSLPRYEVMGENEVLDLDFEDHAWGPAPTNFKMPAFLRKQK